MEYKDIRKLTEDQAREYLEKVRWPEGPVCIHCGDAENIVRIQANKSRKIRLGLLRCRSCRKQFTVTVGTIFHRSHIPLKTWLEAFALICASKKGMSALQLQRLLGLGSYQTAWHMAHRIRHCMDSGMGGMFGGPGKDVIVDESWVGPRPNNVRKGKRPGQKGISPKIPVVGLVEKGGRAYSIPVRDVSKKVLYDIMRKHIDPASRLLTDSANWYDEIGREFEGGHETVNHGRGEYARKTADGDTISTNEIESYWGLFKRGVVGSFHHVSANHMHRYCNEFSFRWSHRKISDGERTLIALKGAEGKRLTYREPSNAGR